MPARFQICLSIAAWLFLTAAGLAQQDGLDQAKALYGSAAYDEALAMLDRLQAGTLEETGKEVALYRMFCLLVLDRRDEAAVVIEEIVTSDPFYLPAAGQASPRIRGIFEEGRKALLPVVARQLYVDAKEALALHDPTATAQFDRLVRLLADPGLQNDGTLADLRFLATEFRDLAEARTSEAGKVPGGNGETASGKRPPSPVSSPSGSRSTAPGPRPR
ncbi:MAG: hypothetical protein AB7F99_05845 [Vicinamibacterales bacterium]